MRHHLEAVAQIHEHMRRNINAWWPQIQTGAETLIVTARGCDAMIKDYGRLQTYLRQNACVPVVHWIELLV